MAVHWKTICSNCRHLNSQEPNQHCYMFKDAPDNTCMQHTDKMEKAKLEGKTVTKAQLCEIVKSVM